MTIETVGDHVARATGRLKAAGIDGPRREARLLLAQTFGKSVEWLVAHDDELIETPAPFENAVRRREDCVKLVSTLERAQRIMDELRAMPIEGALFDSAF